MSETNEITVLLVEDEAPIDMAFRQALTHDARFKYVGNSLGRTNFEKHAKQFSPNIIVIDLYLPISGKLLSPVERKPRLEEGLWHIERARVICPEAKIVAMSNYFLTNAGLARQVLEKGADAYLPKHNAPQGEEDWTEWLKHNLWLIYRGNWQPDSEMASEADANAQKKSSILSDREIEVVKLFAQNKTDLEIANHLYLADNTVRSHFKNILGKLHGEGVTSRRDIIEWALKNEIIK